MHQTAPAQIEVPVNTDVFHVGMIPAAILTYWVNNWTAGALEAENTRLKKLLADAMLDNAMLKEIASKKW